jgi:hypothetical protein
MKRWILEVKEDPDTGDSILEFPPDLLEETGWKEGDELIWTDNKDGSFTLTKKPKTQWVLVEAVSLFRLQYMVEVPVGTDDYGNDKAKWALDTVTCEEAKEFYQEHIGENIVSHRVVTQDEALEMFRKENPTFSGWSDDLIMKNHFTTWKEQNESN